MSKPQLPGQVKIVEVGPRDGLQNETVLLESSDKIALIERLQACGLAHIETGSFVSATAVPQMADSAAVLQGLRRKAGVCYSALTPNLQGLERAISAGASEVAVFTAASEAFTTHNIRCSIEESLRRFEPLLLRANKQHIAVRAYISCVIACPYSGRTDARLVGTLSRQLLEMGCYEISLGDTIGVATPGDITQLIETVTQQVAIRQLALHCHDTYGQALANIYAALQAGVSTFDSAVAGLGGCPYAPGASGNVATEDLIYMLNGLGIESGVALSELIETGNFISAALGRSNASRVAQAMTPMRVQAPTSSSRGKTR